MIAQRDRIRQCSERFGVFDHAGHAIEIRDGAESDHQVVVVQFQMPRLEARADRNHLIFQIDTLNFAHHQMGCAGTAGGWAKQRR